LDKRRVLQVLMLDSSESLIQSETEEEFQENLTELNENERTIQNRDEICFKGTTDFCQWFNQY
jgi:hypothetical protein